MHGKKYSVISIRFIPLYFFFFNQCQLDFFFMFFCCFWFPFVRFYFYLLFLIQNEILGTFSVFKICYNNLHYLEPYLSLSLSLSLSLLCSQVFSSVHFPSFVWRRVFNRIYICCPFGFNSLWRCKVFNFIRW